MQTIKQIEKLRTVLNKARKSKKTIGLVPTMGALHEGHRRLIQKCRRECDVVILSIFVNRTQFGLTEDFRSYPRRKKSDILLAKKENVDIIFYPSEKEIYPKRYLTYIEVGQITNTLCGKFRPGHFRGVTTIVGKLLNIILPHKLYLGQKDAQQVVVIRQMIYDLNWPVKVSVVPTIREKDGLAISSRNQYLSLKQRQQATALYQGLKQAKKAIQSGERNTGQIRSLIRTTLRAQGVTRIDYIECVDTKTLESLKRIRKNALIAVAVRLGKARLIDNIIVRAR